MVDQAARAVATGACEAVLCVAAQPLLSGVSRDDAVASMARRAAHAEAEAPTGIPVPGLYALLAARHMHEYGTTRGAIGRRRGADARACRAEPERRISASRSPSRTCSRPSRSLIPSVSWIARRSRMAAPLSFVTTASRARAIKPNAAYLLGSGYGLSHGFLTDADDPLRTGAIQSGPSTAFATAGLRPADMEFACLYDCFTITLLLELEQLGFCELGESGGDGRGRCPSP